MVNYYDKLQSSVLAVPLLVINNPNSIISSGKASVIEEYIIIMVKILLVIMFGRLYIEMSALKMLVD